jgi:hypothetical protein
MPGQILFVESIVRQDLKDNRRLLFAFGDNLQRWGLGGQARQMRGEYNAIGVPTKREPHRNTGAFFTDADWPMAKPFIDEAFAKLTDHCKRGGTVVFPAAGFGTGLARLEHGAPSIYAAIERRVWQVCFVGNTFPAWGITLQAAMGEAKVDMKYRVIPKHIALRMIQYLSHPTLATIQRYSPAGHPWFTDGETYAEFNGAFARAGGMTPSISKLIDTTGSPHIYNSRMFEVENETGDIANV